MTQIVKFWRPAGTWSESAKTFRDFKTFLSIFIPFRSRRSYFGLEADFFLRVLYGLAVKMSFQIVKSEFFSMSRGKKERVGILGGTFDPVHNGHLGMAAEASEKFGLNRTLFVPANISPHKQEQPVTPAEFRLEMLRLAIRPYPAFAVSEIELRRGGVSYTVDTVEQLQAAYPESELFLIVGLDTFKEMGSWKEPLRLMETCHILVGTRPGHELTDPGEWVRRLSGGNRAPRPRAQKQGEKEGTTEFRHRDRETRAVFFKIAPRDISSSEIRRRVRDNEGVKNMLPPDVEHYIIEHQLYRAQPHPIT